MRVTTLWLCLALLIVGGCSREREDSSASTKTTLPSATPSTSTALAAPPPAPAPGACYQLTRSEAVAPTNESQPVRCQGRWTSRTFFVGDLDTETGDGHLLAVDSLAAHAQISEECPRRLANYLGGTPEDLRLSLFRAIWFTPRLEEAELGAAWFRCDVVALAKPGRLARLRGNVRNILNADFSAYALCGTDRPGDARFARVTCGQPHTWVALRSVDLPGKNYPGRQQVSSLGVAPCTEAARAVAADALDFQWGYEWPTQPQWEGADGQPPQRYGVCWAPADGS